jgi:large subunit ribosomal protein L20
MYGLKLADIKLNRKVLSDLAVNNGGEFANLVLTAKSQLTK